jgi:hypothetical protein
MKSVNALVGLLFLIPALSACSGPGDDHTGDPAVVDSPRHEFWQNLAHHCGNAYRGGLTLEPPGDEMLTGTEELIVHFRECEEERLKLPFHIEIEQDDSWDRSRTWVYMRHDDALELRHDHRYEDGSEHDNNWYGGLTRHPGSAQMQEFIVADRTGPDGALLGWRIEIVPDERYTYGTIRGGEWTWRVDFDLSETVAPPPAPWGHQ